MFIWYDKIYVINVLWWKKKDNFWGGNCFNLIEVFKWIICYCIIVLVIMFFVVFYVKEIENINFVLVFKIYLLIKCVNILIYNLLEEICY